jgi:hypothetical protein
MNWGATATSVPDGAVALEPDQNPVAAMMAPFSAVPFIPPS